MVCAALEWSQSLRRAADLVAAGSIWVLLGGAAASCRWPSLLEHPAVRWVGRLAFPLTLLLPVLQVYGHWSSGVSDGSHIGGVIPYSDAGDYWLGAERLLHGLALDSWNSRRPLNAALLAVRLALVGGHHRGAVLAEALMLGGGIYLAGRSLTAALGTSVGATSVALLLLFARIFVSPSLSESLGLTLGCLALTLLIAASFERRIVLLAVGFGALGLALQARPGALFCIPTLLGWTVVAFGPTRLSRLRAACVGVLGASCSVGVTLAVTFATRAMRGAGQANFAFTLYGLAKGGTGWHSAELDYPQLRGMSDAQQASLLYERSFAAIREHPGRLMLGLYRGADDFVQHVTARQFDTGRLFPHHPWMAWTVVGAAVLIVWARLAHRNRVEAHPSSTKMLGAVVLGAIASLPVIFFDGRDRVFAPVAPFVAAYASALLYDCVRPEASIPEDHLPGSDRGATVYAGVAAVALAVLAVAGAWLAPMPRIHEEALCLGLPGDPVLAAAGLPFFRVVKTRSDVARPEDIPLSTLTERLRPDDYDPAFVDALRTMAAGDLMAAAMTRQGFLVYLLGHAVDLESLARTRPNCSAATLGSVTVVRAR
jgi:hypothetical protein